MCFGGFQALRDVSWSIDAGRILEIIGPNGAGKSTCFMAAANMTSHTGRLMLEGADVTHVRAHRLPRLGIRRTFQQNAFFGGMTVLRNMAGALLDRSVKLARRLVLRSLVRKPKAAQDRGGSRAASVALRN